MKKSTTNASLGKGAKGRGVESLEDVIDPFAPETMGMSAAQLYGPWVSSGISARGEDGS